MSEKEEKQKDIAYMYRLAKILKELKEVNYGQEVE